MIDLYCERLGPGHWAEPVNVLTNLSFLVAAISLGVTAYKRHQLDAQIALLMALVAIIGVSSSLFHTLASVWAGALDELSILIFQLVFLWLYGRKVMHFSTIKVSVLLALFLFLIFFSRQYPQFLNGSLVYLPAVLILTVLGIYHRRHAAVERHLLIWASAVFVVSVCFRSIDLLVCGWLPVGTHFLWHLCNGLVLYLVTRAYLLNRIAMRH